MIQLSLGQERVREIIAEYYPEYIEQRNRTGKENHYEIAYQLMRPIFIGDHLIKADPITGRCLENCGISSNYLRWLSCKAGDDWNKFRCEGSVSSEIHLDKHHPDGNKGFAYAGGVKYNSTFNCLIGLHEQKLLRSEQWDFIYYPQDGIIKSGSGGHHRTIAHVLYGEPRMNPDHYYIVDVRSDCQLHDSFLFVEKLVKELTKRLQSNKRNYNRRLFFKVINFASDEEIDLIRSFREVIDENDWKNLIKIFSHDYAINCFVDRESINIYQLMESINSSREILGRRTLYGMLLIAQDWWNQPSGKSTVLEQVLLDLPSFRK